MAAFPVWVVVPLRLATVVPAVVGLAPATAAVFRELIFFIALFSYSYQRYAPRAAPCTFGVIRRFVDLIPSQFAGGLGGTIRLDSGDRVGGQWKCGRWLYPTADWLHNAHVVFDLVSAVVSIPLAVSVSKAKLFLERRQPTLILLRGRE